MDRLIFEKALDFITHYFTQEQVFRIVDKKVSEWYFKINEKGNEQSHIKIGKFDLVFKTTLKADGREERFTHWAEMMKTFGQVQPELLQGMLPLMLKDTDSPIVADVEELLAQAELIAQSAQNLAQENAQNQIHKEQRGIYNVTYNGKFSTPIKKDLDALDQALRYAQDNKNKGAKHIRLGHTLDKNQIGYVSTQELLNLGKNIRESSQTQRAFYRQGRKQNLWMEKRKRG